MPYLHENSDFKRFVDNHLLACQTSLVDELMKREFPGFTFDNVSNTYDEEQNEFREIFEWWIVDSRLLNRLEEKGEPVLRTDFGTWWGRCTTGQACRHDDVLLEIWNDLKNIT